MSENREVPTPGDPVEEEVSTQTEVLAAARRATEEPGIADEQAHREEVSKVDTELNMESPNAPEPVEIVERVEIVEVDQMPSAAAAPRDGEIPVDSADQFAALYTSSPMPPDIKGNRGAGVLVSVLAALVFAVVFAGIISITIAQDYPPSTFLTEGLLPRVLTFQFGGAVLGFLIAQIVLVLILGKSSWWAYVIGGFFVAAVVWIFSIIGGAMHDAIVVGDSVHWAPLGLVSAYGLVLVSLIAAVVAREVSLWFGVWIGSRGRKVRKRNAEALAEYDKAVAEAGPSGR